MVFNWSHLEWEMQYGDSILIRPDPNDPDFQSKALQALIKLDSTPTGHRALDAIEASGHTVTIERYNNPKDPFNATTTASSRDALAPPAGSGKGADSTIAWDPSVNSMGGPPGTVPDWQSPGSDIILGHELIHAAHNATGTNADGPTGAGTQVSEERNTTGLPPQTYTRPGDPLNGTALPDTRGGPFNENQLRDDYRNRGTPTPTTGKPPEPRPSYFINPSSSPPAAPGTPQTPF
jgi:hypothetical protein